MKEFDLPKNILTIIVRVFFLSLFYFLFVILSMEDKQIVLACQSWDLAKFWELYDKYINKIYKFIYLKTSSQQTAEDITSEVFIKAMNSIWNFDTQKDNFSFQSWIYTIAQNKVIDFYRTNKQTADIEECYDLGQYTDFASKVDNNDKLNEVKEYLNTLKSEQKEIIILRIWEDLSYKEIAEITWKTEDNCKKIVSRNLKNISANFIIFLFILFLI